MGYTVSGHTFNVPPLKPKRGLSRQTRKEKEKLDRVLSISNSEISTNHSPINGLCRSLLLPCGDAAERLRRFLSGTSRIRICGWHRVMSRNKELIDARWCGGAVSTSKFLLELGGGQHVPENTIRLVASFVKIPVFCTT